ncbi:putative Ig domain-containing protein [Mesorhizobium qingshengii]|uniref:Outer membrane autotransporter barrel domain-containing protein n=1 Tax=Mesorhizobium qingshengii TaxID=1165689 RepID=A0A1G5ZEB5_9HYPH|nr:putative Ig domain-containing protein [Mesorhizobium qingshengii]SDA92623.1 outer membrane autotransporter barrel domain-containing protein [Mesorhizobium qingshengii]
MDRTVKYWAERSDALASRFLLWVAMLAFLGMAALAPSEAQAAPSLGCPAPITFTVASGGSHQIDASSCDPFGTNPQSQVVQPAHGHVTIDNPSAGLLTYVNNGDGALSDSFTFEDASAGVVTVNVTVLPASSPITVTPASLPTPAVGVFYDQTLSSSGGVAPYTYTSGGGSLPPGLSLAPNGRISGTPTGSGPYNYTVHVVDSTAGTPLTADKSYSLSVAGPTLVVSPTNPPAGAVGFAYSQQLSTSGGTAPYTYSVEIGPLPAGLSLSSSGLISGTPSAQGTVTFKVKSQDSTTISTGGVWFVTQDITVVINAAPTIVVNPATVPGGTVGLAYSGATMTGSGGTGPYTFTISAGSLPAGLTLNGTTGALSGTPTAGGTVNFTVQATDSSTAPGPFSGTRAYTLTIAAPTISLPATTLADGTAGSAYSAALNPATGGTSPYTYAVTGGALPPGVALSASGNLSGTPSAAGSFNFSVTATDSSTGTGPYSSAPQAYTLNVVNIPPVANAVSATVAYDSSANPITLNITGGTPTSVAVGTAATHGTATASGTTISYTPTAGYAGPDSFTYTATNTAGTSAPATVTITISDPTIVVAASGALTAQVGVAYTQTFTASGGAAPYTLSVSGLPAGLSASGTNSVTVSGTPTEAGSFALNVTGADSSTGNGPFAIAQPFTLTVAAPTLSMAPAAGTLSAAYGAAYSQLFTASGGTAPYSYTVSAGALPAGLALDLNSGLLSGTPTVTGPFTFSVQATDSSTGTGAPFARTQNYVLQVGAPTIAITPASLADAAAGAAYTPVSLVASGGVGPYSFLLSAGPLPNGMSLTSAGVLSGTPTQSGTFPITVQAQDANGQTGTQGYSLQVLVPGLTVSPASLPGGVAGTAYSQTFSASGGTSPYSFALTSGTLPAGLTLAAGALTGTPTVAGSFSFTVTATDSTTGTAATGSRPYTLIVAAPTITLAPATLPAGQFGVAYSQTLTANGGTGPYTYVMTGTPPTGITLSSAGVLSGTPAEFGSFNITATATDSLGFTGTANYTLVIGNNPPVANPETAETFEGQPVTIHVTDNDTGTITSVAIATAPAHGTASVSGTDIVYTPGASFNGSDTLTYTATGPGGTSTPATVTINVRPLPVPVAQHVTTVSGKAVVVDLTKDAVGGPFTSASLVSVPPSSSGTTVLNGFQMTFTPTATFQGTETVTFTLSNAYATSAVTAITIEVVERPDPTLDSEVMGILNAETAATRRFATSQIGNFQQRLEGLHDGDNGQEPTDGLAFVQGIVLSFDSTCGEAEQAAKGPDCGRSKASDPNWPFKSSLDDTTTSGTPGGFGTGSFGHSKVTIWTGGSINIGQRDGNDGYKFETTGLSAGVDYRCSRAFAIGLGMGYGRDVSDVGDNGSRSTGKAYTAGLYASYHPGQDYFIDGLMGYQWLSFDSKRYLTSGGGFANGERDGGQWFASVSAGKKFEIQEWQISPYARLDVAKAKLDAFTESGDPSSALHYGEQDISTTTGNLGLTLAYKFAADFGVVSPQVRLEYQHDFQGDSAITMNYADMFGGPIYHTSIDGLGKDRFMLGLGVNVQTAQDFNMRLEYRGLFGSDGDTDNGFLVNLGKTF